MIKSGNAKISFILHWPLAQNPCTALSQGGIGLRQDWTSIDQYWNTLDLLKTLFLGSPLCLTQKIWQYDMKVTLFEIFAKGLIMKDIMSLISVITKLFRFHLVWIPTTSLLAVMLLEVKLRWRKTHQILLLSFGTGYVSQGWSQAHHLMTDQTQNHQNHLFHPC